MSPLASLPWLALVASAAVRPAAAKVQGSRDSACDCYVTGGPDAAYYTNYQFYDYRSLSDYAGVPDLIADANASAAAPATSDYFLSDDWETVWGTQTWDNSAAVADGSASVLRVNTRNNVYIESNTDADADSDTYLTLRSARQAGFQSTAEIDSVGADYQFASIRMLARTTGGPGAVTAIFTYLGADDVADVQEADLEIRTEDPDDSVQYTNQPGYTDAGGSVPGATHNVTLPDGIVWTDWVEHRLDWTPGQTTWFANGVEVVNNQVQAPRDPSYIILNNWSDGGSWTGTMAEGDQALMQIKWLEFAYNTTGQGGSCQAVCSID